MKKYKVELSLDILSGCHWKCEGCFVQKEVVANDDELLLKVKNELKQRQAEGIELSHLEIGPTDFLESNNFSREVSKGTVKDLISMFDEVFLTTTFSRNQNFSKYISLIDSKKIRLFINFNIRNNVTNFINKQTLIERDILNHYPEIEVYYIPMGYLPVNIQVIKQTLISIKASKLKGIVSFNYACGRLQKPKREVLINEISKISELNTLLGKLNMDSDRCSLDHRVTKRGFLINSGGLYRMPYVGQFFINNLKELRIKNIKKMFSQDEQILQGVKSINKSECLSCSHLESCKDHFVLSLMDELEVESCINSLSKPHSSLLHLKK